MAGTRIEWADNVRVPEYVGVAGARVDAEGRREVRFTGLVRRLPERILEPTRWRTPRRIFCGSMTDPFFLGDPWMFSVVVKMAEACPRHTFLLLTKRAREMGGVGRNVTMRVVRGREWGDEGCCAGGCAG